MVWLERLFVDRAPTLDHVVDALKALRLGWVDEEYDLQKRVAACLASYGIGYIKEYPLSLQCRIDFFIPGGIGIEVKKGKHPRSQVLQQITRYLSHKEVTALVVVTERALHLPVQIHGKDCISICLSKLWGVAL